jgi:hypothetical protein
MELDKALVALGKSLDDSTLLVDLARIEELRSTLDVPLLEILSWFALIDTAEDTSEEEEAKKTPSHYEQVFLAPPQRVDTFALNEDRDELESTSATVLENATLVAGALRISVKDLTLLLDYLGTGVTMSLATLSRLYRLASLARRLDLSIRQLLYVIKISGTDPSDIAASTFSTAVTMEFVERARALSASGFSIEELSYLLRHEVLEEDGVAPEPSEIGEALTELQTALGTVETVEDSGGNPTEETLTKKKQLLVQTLAGKHSLSTDVAALLLGEILTGRSGAESGDTAVDDLLEVEAGGLWASYYPSDDFTGTVAQQRIDSPVDQEWETKPSFITGDEFSVRWEGMVRAQKSGKHKFDVTSQDATIVLWVGGQKRTLSTGEVALKAGVCYDIPEKVQTARTYSELKALGLGPLSNVLIEAEQALSWVLEGIPLDRGKKSTAVMSGASVKVLASGLSQSTDSSLLMFSPIYSWFVTQLSGLYFQCYKLAYGMARSAARAFEHELGKEAGSTS